MARVPDFPTAAHPVSTGSPRTVQCPECGVVLNVPPSAAGHRLKCPRCETRFVAPGVGEGPSSSTFPAMNGSSAASSMYAPQAGGSSGDFVLPASPPPLRDQFDLPSLSDGPTTQPVAAPVSDAAALFLDEPKSARKPAKGAEARAKVRRCPTCSSVVQVGMSLCSRCGLDLDTGQRVETIDLFDEAPVAPRQTSFPMGVALIGGIAALASGLLAVISLVAWTRGLEGAQFLLGICLFGIYASVQFLRRKSVRLLVIALSLGLFVDVLALIALPVYNANAMVGTGEIDIGGAVAPSNEQEFDGPQIHSLQDQLNMEKISWGIALMLGYAALAVYLNSPSFRRQFARH